MWPSALWKSSSKAKTIDEANANSTPSVVNDGGANGGRSGHQLSLLTLTGNTSVPGMMPTLSSTGHSASALNAVSFVASTPAPANNLHSHDEDMTSISAESASYGPLCPHNELQCSTQIENVQCQKENDYNEQIRSGYRTANEIESLSCTPSRFQVSSMEKAVFRRDTSNRPNLQQVRAPS